MIERILFSKISHRLNKAVVVLGARQTGKTTLLKKVCEDLDSDFLLLDCDDPFTRSLLEDRNTQELKRLIGSSRTVFIDEAQRVKNIGITAKIIIDQLQSVQLFISGSSALELANEVNEPLTGRKWEYMLYPISWSEVTNHYGYLQAMQQLENRLIYGMYPEVITNAGIEHIVLKNLASSNLYKDLLSYSGIRKPELLERLLQALALQIGNEVSFDELSNTLQVDKKTIRSYIDLLEKAFIIFKLKPLSRNSRKEISTNRKVYFYDLGVRNSMIANFNPLALRNDVGALWENFLIAERIKHLSYSETVVNCYFWRTTRQQEIDFVEERNGRMHAYEFKWNSKRKYKFPTTFSKLYPSSATTHITRDNFNDFLTAEIT